MNKKNELSLNDLEKVAGGVFKDSFIIKNKDGSLSAIDVSYDGNDEATHQKIVKAALAGKMMVEGVVGNYSIEHADGIEDYNAYVSLMKDDGYKIHNMF